MYVPVSRTNLLLLLLVVAPPPLSTSTSLAERLIRCRAVVTPDLSWPEITGYTLLGTKREERGHPEDRTRDRPAIVEPWKVDRSTGAFKPRTPTILEWPRVCGAVYLKREVRSGKLRMQLHIGRVKILVFTNLYSQCILRHALPQFLINFWSITIKNQLVIRDWIATHESEPRFLSRRGNEERSETLLINSMWNLQESAL